jgi:O-antigen/teichoic acid export membrane protein
MQLRSLSTKTKVVVGAALAGLALAFYEFAPRSIWPKCPIHTVTGIYCPGCGGQRWLSSILHGDFTSAWHYNQLDSLSPLFIAAYFLVRKFKPGILTNVVFVGVLVAGLIAFVIWRNLPPQVNFLKN